MLKLEEIIDAAEGREIKRAVAVKMVILGFTIKDIGDLLEVFDSFVSKWKTIYENEGASGHLEKPDMKPAKWAKQGA